MQLFTDRIEGDVIVAEDADGKQYTLPLSLLPGVREGDCIEITINKKETENRRKKIESLMDELFRD